MSIDRRHERAANMTDRTSMRVPVALLLGGQLLYILVTQFHVGGNANDHQEIFAEYAASSEWKAVHAAQFLAMTLIIAGLIAVFARDVRLGTADLTTRIGTASAVVALALYGVLQAVDGVGNQEVDEAWVNASATHEAAAFASADAMRWLEWGARSYHDYALGIALILFAVASRNAQSASIPRMAVYLVGLTGFTYLVQGWVVGSEGFSGTHTILILVAWVLSLTWMIWLAVRNWWRPSAQAPEFRRSTP